MKKRYVKHARSDAVFFRTYIMRDWWIFDGFIKLKVVATFIFKIDQSKSELEFIYFQKFHDTSNVFC